MRLGLWRLCVHLLITQELRHYIIGCSRVYRTTSLNIIGSAPSYRVIDSRTSLVQEKAVQAFWIEEHLLCQSLLISIDLRCQSESDSNTALAPEKSTSNTSRTAAALRSATPRRAAENGLHHQPSFEPSGNNMLCITTLHTVLAWCLAEADPLQSHGTRSSMPSLVGFCGVPRFRITNAGYRVLSLP
jgi:hypothetical protein